MKDRVNAATVCEQPWPHLEFDTFLKPEHAELLARDWPSEGWDWVKHSDSVLPDGTSRRRCQRLEWNFPVIAADLFSGEEALRKRLGVTTVALWPIALLVEDAPGYWIRKHTDCAGKVISSQCYLPQAGNDESAGVLLEDGKQIPYRMNHGYAFKVTKSSWHRVRRCMQTRRSLQLTFYDLPNPAL